MKLMNTLKCTVLGLVACAAMSGAYAQNVMSVDVPFAFEAGGKTVPSGKYQVSVNYRNNLVTLMNHDQKAGTMLLGNGGENGRSGEYYLTFNRYGETYFLSRICVAGHQGIDVRKGRTEREYIARTSATQVTLTASR